MKISIHRALAELKLLDKRINKELNSGFEVSTLKPIGQSVTIDGRSVDYFIKKADSKIQSVLDLIARRDEIKRKVVLSNATTKVFIGGKEYTVAEAIEQKSFLANKRFLVQSLKENLAINKASLERKQAQVETNLEKQLEALNTGNGKDNNDLKGFIDTFRNKNGYELVTATNLVDYIEKLDNETEAFISEVDAVLSESNAITTIEI